MGGLNKSLQQLLEIPNRTSSYLKSPGKPIAAYGSFNKLKDTPTSHIARGIHTDEEGGLTDNPSHIKENVDLATPPPIKPQDSSSSWDSLFDGIDQRTLPIHRKARLAKKRPLFDQEKDGEFRDDERQMFKKLLDNLLDRPKKATISETIASPSQRRSGVSAIERQLLELMEQKTPIFKKSFPKALIPSVFSKPRMSIDDPEWQERWQDDDNKIFRHLPTSVRHPKIQEKDIENSVINRLLECQSNFELRQFVVTEIFNHQSSTPSSGSTLSDSPMPRSSTLAIPSYYSSLIATAIFHSLSFNDPYMALAIFEQAKRRGIESYVAGCTTRVYNTILRTRWNYWRDIRGMEGLVEEMMVNGVGFDDDTRRVVIEVRREMEEDSGGEIVQIGEWGEEERRALNRMKQMVGKWLVK
ncbi:hypothetical protein BC937DRAFT_93251 [Endogone sp. FLAS-F59071]|nr:hypothetical protein BC937DRAFT_93251 [Endogone sp. FLAS-F59071]|eukprot:RUS14832.1 hypothetical protein BC937DRAFT_93251 [Endogone sp. FLAS-F59071]